MLRSLVRPEAVAAPILALFSFSAVAATPAQGVLTPTSGPITVTSGPFTTSNPTPVPEVDSGPRCNATTNYCDSFALTVSLPAGYMAANPKDKVRITASWPTSAADVDLWMYDGAVGDLNGSQGGICPDGASQNDPEVCVLTPTDGDKLYTIKIVPFAAAGQTVTTTIELVSPPPPPPDTDGDGVADDADQCPDTPSGTTVDAQGCPASSLPELTLHFHGNTHETPDACTGVGNTDFVACGGPFLKESGDLDPDAPAARFDYAQADGTNGQGPYDANWTWTPAANAQVGGYTVVNFWASCNGECVLVGGTWDVQLFKNNTQKVGEFLELEATPSSPNAPSLLSVAFRLPAPILLDAAAGDTLTLKIEAHFADTGQGSSIFYDSTQACPGAAGSAACDSVIIFNATPPPPPPPPQAAVPGTGLPPRYQIHVSPPALGNDAGEPSVGFNKLSQHTMFISYTQALRQTYQEEVQPPLLPASCPALWEDKSGTLTTVNSLDPILFTDEATGRTFNSQLSGDNSLMEYTDNDGEAWTPAQAGPPNGGADHQAVATGVYPAGFVPPSASWPATGPKRAVYYCSQSVAGAFCSRSDDGGRTFGPGFPFKNTDCAAGALHGHVKVAPDGTVYVPDSSQCVLPTGETAEHVLAFVSDNAGQTWAVRDVPFSNGGDGSDPSIGIATDGTVYMCYTDADSSVHMAWSSDKGQTWAGGVNLGIGAGIVQTRFPQAIAGDPDRAACAFLGTTTEGNGNSLDFEGVWHGYVATTYDHGATWHVVNVTPDDPVQGYGGVGPSGTNRNLLDFNDLQIDDEGRTYFAFADGCIGGCVQDPSANSFAAKATIVRQTGGRTLLAAFDNAPATRFNNPTPLAPAAACARQDISTRSPIQATVKWNAPDTGGTDVTTYRVYRATDPAGPFALVGSAAGTKSSFIDTATNPSVEKYYYQVEAENPVGIAPMSNVIELPINAQEIDTCTLPGQVIALDAEGDGAGDDTDIVYLAVAEPAAYPDSFVITEKIADFTADTPPASSFYPILFPTKGSLYIALDATQGPAKFAYGTYRDVGQGVLAFTENGDLPGSSWTADGTITFVVPRTLLGDPAVGGVIAGFDARARVGSQSATSRDTAGPTDYTVRGNAMCGIADPVLATLTASLNNGAAPLGVTFTLGGTPPDGRTLASYSLDFGDGSAPATGAFSGASAQVAHTYAAAGVYRALLTVTDSEGQSSTNLAEQTITVVSGVGNGGNSGNAALGNNSVGGALPALSLLMLTGLAALRRRRQS